MPTGFYALREDICADLRPGWQAWRWPPPLPFDRAFHVGGATGRLQGSRRCPQVSDDLQSRAEEKRRELREAGLRRCSTAPEGRQRGASKVVKVGETATPGHSKAAAEDQYVELGREKTDKIFVILAEFGNSATPRYPDQDTDPATPGPARFDGPLHNQIPEPDRTKDNRRSGKPTTHPSTTAALLRRRGRRSRSRATTSASHRVATASTARSPTGSRCPTTRPATAAATASRVRASSAGTART